MPEKQSRRRVIQLTGVGLLTGLAGCTGRLKVAEAELNDTPYNNQLVEPELNVLSDPYPPEEVSPQDDTDKELAITELTTYTNSQYDYSVQYPAEAQYEENDTLTIFSIEGQPFFQSVLILTYDSSPSMERAIDIHLAIQRENQNNLQIIDQRSVTLSSARYGTILDTTYSLDESTIQSKSLIVPVETTVYEVRVVTTQDRFTNEFNIAANAIVESLTVDS